MPTIHQRAAWQDPRLPVVGPALNWTRIDTIAPHYTAAVNLIDGDLGEYVENLPAYLRAIQRDYNNRKPTGYSIGYNWAIDWLGGIWQLRGWDIKSAAQGFPLNDHVVAVLFFVDGNDEPTVEAMSSFRFLNAQARALAKRKLFVMDHGRLKGAATGCAGTGIRRVVDAGWLDDQYNPTPQPPPPTGGAPLEDDPMILTNSEPWFGAPVGTAKFKMQRNGRLKLLTPAEWDAECNGTPISNAATGELGVDS